MKLTALIALRSVPKTSTRLAKTFTTSSRPRSYSSAVPTAEKATQALSSRWLSDVKTRIGHCITFGLNARQKQEAGHILQEIAQDWRALVVGSEGFLTSKERLSMFRLPVVWGDQDSMGHVNNTKYNRWAETGRVEWASNYAKYIDPENVDAWRDLCTPKGVGMILRKITTEFKFPMTYPDHVTIYHKLAKEPTEGTDAIDLDVVILSELHQRIAARCTEDCALYDYRAGKKTNMRPFMLDVLQHTWKLQEEARRINSQRVVYILDRVRQLELNCWDRVDAVEDMGGVSK